MNARNSYRNWIWVAGLALLLVAGVLNRWARSTRAAAAAAFVPLVEPLDSIPQQIGPYRGQDVPLRADVMQAAGVDSYVQREYVDHASGRRILLYVGYWGRENIGAGHGPEVCYPAAGWQVDSAAQEQLIRVPDRETAAMGLHRFVRMEPEGIRRCAVGFLAVVSGRLQPSSRGVFWHRPGYTLPDGGHFLAHVHVSALPARAEWEDAEADIIEFTELVMPYINASLPQGIE